MALQKIVTLIDDLDGSESARTIRFSWQDTAYEVDLSDANRERFLRAIEPYITAGRKVGPSGSRTAR
jgi:hypothetical protein